MAVWGIFGCQLICSFCLAATYPERVVLDVKSSDTLESLGSVDATLLVSFGQRRQIIELIPSGLGRFLITTPAEKWTDLHLHLSSDKHVFREIHWTPANLPDHFLFLLDPGIEIGGKVIDYEGNLLKGAKVGIRFFQIDEEKEAISMVDDPFVHWEATHKDGVWSCSHIPADSTRLEMMVQYPNLAPARYFSSIRDSGFHVDQVAEFDELKRKRVVFILKTGVKVEGLVIDPDGMPLAGVKVTGGSYPTWTNSQGKFLLRNKHHQPLSLFFHADGFYSIQKTLSGEMTLEQGVVVMKAVKPTIVEFKNEAGEPVEGVFLSNSRWNHIRIKDWRWFSNDEGKVEWSGGVDVSAEFDVFHPDYQEQQRVNLIAGETNRIDLNPVPVLKLHIMDQLSGRGIRKLEVRTGHAHDDGIHWISSHEVHHESGHYSIPIRDFESNRLISLIADHYPDFIIELPAGGLSDRELKIRMKALHTLSGKVIGSDGLPLEGAEIACSTASARPVIGRYHFMNSPLGKIARSGEDGAFSIHSRKMPSHVIAIHSSGVAIVDWNDFLSDSELKLEPWGSIRVENRLSDEDLTLGVFALGSFPTYPLELHSNTFHQQVVTRRDFIFEFVPSGKFLFGQMKEGSLSHVQMVDSIVGQEYQVVMKTGSGTVRGVVSLPETMKDERNGHVDGWLVRYPLESEKSADLPTYARDFLLNKGFRYMLEIDDRLQVSGSRLPPGAYWVELYYHAGPHQDDNESFRNILRKQINLEPNVDLDLETLRTSFD